MNVEMSREARELVVRERDAISDLRALLGRLEASSEDLEDLRNAHEDLEGIFMLVVCGEYNSGKSSLLNALLGETVVPEGVTPTTDRITILGYGEEMRDTEESGWLMRRSFPSELLKDLALVDTPGTNAIITRHQELTERFIPRADLVLFVTSADRPFTQSERAFLELISTWGKKITVVVNKIDILESSEERQKVLDFVREHARETLQVTPQVFAVASRKAFRARKSGNPANLAGTGLPELEAYIEASLYGGERLRLKLQSPLGVAEHVGRKYLDNMSGQLSLLEDDRRTLEEIDRQRSQYERDMRREFAGYLVRIKTVLVEVERRGDIFFDDVVRFGNIFNLVNSDRIRKQFEERVIRGADREVDNAVGETVDWFMQRNLQLWEDIMTFVNERRKAAEDRVIGEVGGRFQYDRESLLRNLRERAEDVLHTYDERVEADRLATSLQSAVVRSGLLQVGGLGMGAAIVAFLSGAALDVTGIALGLTVAGLGVLVIPRRRTRAKKELHNKMQALRDGLEESLGGQLEKELHRASEKLSGALLPYTRFVRSELGRMDELQADLAELVDRIAALRRDVVEIRA
ncbi:MAG: dynamin family protein [Trueperaceae bacterium]